MKLMYSHALALSACLTMALGCSGEKPQDAEEAPTGQVSAAVVLVDAHDVASVEVKIVDVDEGCAGEAIAEKTVPLESETLPVQLGGSGTGDGHLFSDALFVLEPGEYLVCATPLDEDGNPSVVCAAVSQEVEVVAEQTEEILLISQCVGNPSGGLDVITALNDPPHIDDLVIAESKFITTCETAQITVSASDPNADALSYEWEVLSGPAGASVVGMGPSVTFIPGAEGDYELKVTVTDPYGATASLTFPIHVSGAECDASRTYTIDGDFDEGSLINLEHDPDDQLQLINQGQACNSLWVAASARGTIVKIDSQTGAVLGEYLSAPDGRGRNPSRTTVDADCNVWATNRDEFEGDRGSVVNIGLLENSQCEDRNGNGVIDTSTGLGDIRGWTNAGLADNQGGVSTAEDECIVHYTRVTGTATRHVSLDVNNNVWVGGFGDRDFELLDNATGNPIPGTQFNLGCGAYGGVTDHNGIVWSAQNPLLRWDPFTNTGMCLSLVPAAYRMAVDPNTGHIWVSELGGSDSLHEIDPVTNTVLQILPQNLGGAQGVAVDDNSHVWVAQIFGANVAHFAPDPMNPGSHVFVGLVPGFAGTTGVSVAADGKIWASEINSSLTRGAARIDPNGGPIGGGGYSVGVIDLTVGLDAPGLPFAGPYNYSDMTGSQLIAPPNAGNWTVIYDAGVASEFGIISWNDEPEGATPSDSQILVQVRSSDDQVTWSATENVSDGADVMSPDARFLEIQVQLIRASTGESPILSDLTISSTPL